jgi:hypothetical protein
LNLKGRKNSQPRAKEISGHLNVKSTRNEVNAVSSLEKSQTKVNILDIMKAAFLQAFAVGRRESAECNAPNQAKKLIQRLKGDSKPEKQS